ncbi:MAG: SRPBCC family protein [Bacteroidota bacterium]
MYTKAFTSIIQKSLLVPPEQRNLGTAERFASTTLGSLLSTLGLKKIGKGGLLLTLSGGYLLWRGASGYCPLTDSFGWDTTEGTESFRLKKSVYISTTPEEIYSVWRNFEDLPKYFKHLKQVKKIDDTTYEWTAVFNGQEFTWNAQVMEDMPGRRISWRTIDPKDVENYGRIEFNEIPEIGETQVKLMLIYRPAKTELGRFVAAFLTPIFRRKLKNDLRRFRDQMNVLYQKDEEKIGVVS